MINEKCNCNNYERGDHSSPLIKLDLPEYEDYRYRGTSHTVRRALRIVSYVAVLILLSYALWRIRAIESKIEASDRLLNITRKLQTSDAIHNRNTRSIQEQMLMNSFGDEKSTLGKDVKPWKKPTNKGEFDELVNNLFGKIKAMHDDPDRGHFDRNMKAVFQAWFPVFDALLPKELKEDNETRQTREAREEYFYEFRREKAPGTGQGQWQHV
ncbi:uncharacterized protein LOC131669826 [Phymastichus coffea]|uniref:uncharacterized protein LOC131669826 n=1 Tax=Phymastichus coffea TaxID=108790 RepID=UPI00273C3DC9|nr:uncharacterized protein LOC131669826 [Phymastichus coffea]